MWAVILELDILFDNGDRTGEDEGSSSYTHKTGEGEEYLTIDTNTSPIVQTTFQLRIGSKFVELYQRRKYQQ